MRDFFSHHHHGKILVLTVSVTMKRIPLFTAQAGTATIITIIGEDQQSPRHLDVNITLVGKHMLGCVVCKHGACVGWG